MTDGPYMDWHDFDIKKGSRIAVEIGGVLYTDTVTDVAEDKETGVIMLTLGEAP